MLVYVRPVERGHSGGARSGSTGLTWVFFHSLHRARSASRGQPGYPSYPSEAAIARLWCMPTLSLLAFSILNKDV